MVRKFGKYEIQRELGKGAMGVVYLAHDVSLSRPAALKVMAAILANDADLVRRFYQEAISAGKLSHPNIVTIYDIDMADGVPYIAMEYLEGQTLQQAIREQQNFSIIRKLDIITQAARGLHFAHQNGVIHRDVKPSNIVILKSGPVKILDFGIAHLEGSGLTQAGSIMGTPYYMSPEQVRGEPVDGRSDIFSLGVVLYETFAMRTPFAGSTIPSVLNRICNTTPPALADLISDCPPELNHIAQRAIAKNREDRYQTAEDFAFDSSRLMTSMRRGMVEEEFERGERLLQQGDLSSAEECLRKVLALDSSHNLARLTLRKLQDQARKQDVERVERLLARAEEAGKARHDEECLALTDEALRIEPANARAQRLREEVTERLEFQQALDSRIAEVLWLWQKGDLDTAREELRRALAVAPHDPRVIELLNDMTRQEAEQRAASQQQPLEAPRLGAAPSLREEISNVHAPADLENIRRRALEEAQALIQRRNFASAIKGIERTIVSTGETPELATLLNLALEEQRKDAQTTENRSAPVPYTPASAWSQQGAGLPPQEGSPSSDADALLENARRNWAQIESQRIETMRLARGLIEKGENARAQALLDSAPESIRRDEEFQSLFQHAQGGLPRSTTLFERDAAAASGPGALDLDLARPSHLGSELETVPQPPAPNESAAAVSPIPSPQGGAESRPQTRSSRRSPAQALLIAAATVLVVIGLLWVLAARRPPSAPPQPAPSAQPRAAIEPAPPPSVAAPVPVQRPAVETSPPQAQPQPSGEQAIASRAKTAHREPAGGHPEFGSLTVTAPEAEVPIVLDGSGEPDWLTPHTFDHLRTGLHHVGVLFKGHESYRDVDVEAGATKSVSLEPEKATCYLMVTTDPPGVGVTLDGTAIGVSPLQKRIPPGSHVVAAQMPSGVQAKSIMVTENSLADLKFP